MRAGFALAIVQHVQARLHAGADLVDLLLQRFHHGDAVFVGVLRELVGLGLRLVENAARLLPGEFRHVLLPGKELRLLVGFAYGVGGTRLRGCDDRVGLRLRAFQTAFRFAHQRGGAFQLRWQHLLEFVELAGERFAVHAHRARREQNRLGLVQFLFDAVDDVVDGGEFVAAAIRTVVERRIGIERGTKVGQVLIGSCTNSSYQDLSRAASIARQAAEDKIPVEAPLIINPGSEQIRYTAERDGILGDFEQIGATVMANACGPCIGQWKRHTDDNTRKNSFVTSFNRNFAKRADGNPNTHAFVASPELTLALTIAGDLCFNPLTDTLKTADGREVKLKEPEGTDFPPKGFEVKDNGYVAPTGKEAGVAISPESDRLQALKPFAAWDGKDLIEMPLLLKAEGKCTTDHISMAGPWLRFRGHLENISDNMLMGAVNAFNGKTNSILNQLNGKYEAVSAVAKQYKAKGISSIVVAEENYGEGSSREHAAMEPRFLNVKVILAKSFARIHETNLKKQGMLALTFADKDDYKKVREEDKISIIGLKEFAPGKPLTAILYHADGTEESFAVNHTYNELQIKWFKAGAALNAAR